MFSLASLENAGHRNTLLNIYGHDAHNIRVNKWWDLGWNLIKINTSVIIWGKLKVPHFERKFAISDKLLLLVYRSWKMWKVDDGWRQSARKNPSRRIRIRLRNRRNGNSNAWWSKVFFNFSTHKLCARVCCGVLLNVNKSPNAEKGTKLLPKSKEKRDEKPTKPRKYLARLTPACRQWRSHL